jgi:hypothetical protein
MLRYLFIFVAWLYVAFAKHTQFQSDSDAERERERERESQRERERERERENILDRSLTYSLPKHATNQAMHACKQTFHTAQTTYNISSHHTHALKQVRDTPVHTDQDKHTICLSLSLTHTPPKKQSHKPSKSKQHSTCMNTYNQPKNARTPQKAIT